MAELHDAQPCALLVVEAGELLPAVEHRDRAGGGELARAVQPGGGPSRQVRHAEPQRAVDAVVVQPRHPLHHDHVGRRPRAEALTEDQHPGTLVRRHRPDPLAHAPDELAELLAPGTDLLQRQERRVAAVLDAHRREVAAGEELGRLDHGVIDPARAGRRHQQDRAAVVGADALHLLERGLAASGRVERLLVEADEHPDRVGRAGLVQGRVDELGGDDVGDETSSLLAEVLEAAAARLAARDER